MSSACVDCVRGGGLPLWGLPALRGRTFVTRTPQESKTISCEDLDRFAFAGYTSNNDRSDCRCLLVIMTAGAKIEESEAVKNRYSSLRLSFG